jgi:hypothetical protein
MLAVAAEVANEHMIGTFHRDSCSSLLSLRISLSDLLDAVKSRDLFLSGFRAFLARDLQLSQSSVDAVLIVQQRTVVAVTRRNDLGSQIFVSQVLRGGVHPTQIVDLCIL